MLEKREIVVLSHWHCFKCFRSFAW